MRRLFLAAAFIVSICASQSVSFAQSPTRDASTPGKVPTAIIESQPSVVFETKEVRVAVALAGGHTAPVLFYRDSDRPIQPYHISPWQNEPAQAMPAPVLNALRGDFFCLPFGGNQQEVHGEKHPPHGEIAGGTWTPISLQTAGDVTTLRLQIETKVHPGKVTKDLMLVAGQNVVYSRHLIEGFSGRYPLGHHATLAMPVREGAMRLASSPIRFGMTYPGLFSDPKQKEYQSLLPGTTWTDLKKVPVAWKDAPDADLTRLPARFGHADLVQIFNKPADQASSLGWMTATNTEAGYLWFSLKDPAVLNSTVFWIENRGRHGHPWNGRNHCLGLEDVTAFFADGLAASASDNILTQQGIATAVELNARQPTAVNYIQGVARIPSDFDIVQSVEFQPDQVTFVAASGSKVAVPVRHEFIKSGKLSP